MGRGDHGQRVQRQQPLRTEQRAVLGSVRFGDNRYATGVATCIGGAGENLFDGVNTGNACNRDDVTHEGAGHDARRNDNCIHY